MQRKPVRPRLCAGERPAQGASGALAKILLVRAISFARYAGSAASSDRSASSAAKVKRSIASGARSKQSMTAMRAPIVPCCAVLIDLRRLLFAKPDTDRGDAVEDVDRRGPEPIGPTIGQIKKAARGKKGISVLAAGKVSLQLCFVSHRGLLLRIRRRVRNVTAPRKKRYRP